MNSKVNAITFLISLLVILGCSNNKNRNNEPPPRNTNPNIGNVPTSEIQWPKIELATEDARLTLPFQQFQLNSITESNSDNIENYFKKYILQSNSRMKIKFDHEFIDFSQCQLPLAVDYEVNLNSEESTDNLKIDLKKESSFIIEDKTIYSITVRVGNKSRCKNINYSFALIASIINNNPTPEPIYTELPSNVICNSKDQIGREKVILFNFVDNEIIIKEKNSKGLIEAFNSSTACLFKLDALRKVNCNTDYQFDGNFYTKSLTCSASKEDGSSKVGISSGRLWFKLNSGEGRLNCSIFSTSRLDLKLSECKAN